jgi:tetratricopeptide (TPR) repeat protein
MKKLSLWVLLMSLGMSVTGAGMPVAGSSDDVIRRLERDIDRASERGRSKEIQSLREQLAKNYIAQSQYGLAARQYELLLASRPSRRDRIQYNIALGQMREAVQNYGGAIAAYQDAQHDDPDSWDANLCLARAYDHAELNVNAIGVYQQCMKLRPTAPEPYEGLAKVYAQLGFLNKAVDHYKKALDREKRPETYLALSDTYARQGDSERAQQILQTAKTLLPRADYDVRLGEIYRKHGALKKACAGWEEALKLDPQRNDVRLQLALAYDRIHRAADSDRMFKTLLAVYPQSPLVHYSRAWVLFARGDHAGAKQEALAVQALGPTAVVQHFNNHLLEELQKKS